MLNRVRMRDKIEGTYGGERMRDKIEGTYGGAEKG